MIKISEIKDKLLEFFKIEGINFFLTFIYIAILFISILYVINIPYNIFDLTRNLNFFFNIKVLSFTLILSLMVAFILRDHILMGVFVLIGFIFILIDSLKQAEGMGAISFIFVWTLTIIILLLFSFFGRYFFKIKKHWIKIVLMIIPFVIILILASSIIIKNQSAIDNNDIDYCDSLNQGISDVECYRVLAVKNNDPTICFRIHDYFDWDYFCLKYLPDKVIKEEMCKDLDGIKKSFCYRYVAERTKDESLCEKIEDEYLKKFCIPDVNKKK